MISRGNQPFYASTLRQRCAPRLETVETVSKNATGDFFAQLLPAGFKTEIRIPDLTKRSPDCFQKKL